MMCAWEHSDKFTKTMKREAKEMEIEPKYDDDRGIISKGSCQAVPLNLVLAEYGKAQAEHKQKLQSPEFLEALAELEHEQWSEFIDWLIRFAPIHGELTAKDFWERYDILSRTPYSALSEELKESDRKFARRVILKFVEVLG